MTGGSWRSWGLLRVSPKFLGIFALLAASGLALAAPSAPQVGTGANWTGHGGDSGETHYSRLAAINSGNVSRLGLAWSLVVPNEAALAGIPLEVDGTLYFTGDLGKVYAVNAVTGKLLWTFDAETWKDNPDSVNLHFKVNHGAAWADGRLFAATIDGKLFALDARTGKELWRVDTLIRDGGKRYTHGAPRAFDDLVIIGNAGGDSGARGYVSAYHAATGKLAWRFFVAPGSPEENKGDPAMEAAARTWGGEYWKSGTGGGPWDAMTFDAELDRIYVATGNPDQKPPDVRSPGGGDNLYTCSIVALDARTGKYLWHYQVNPRDAWDYDSTQQISLATVTIGGVRRKVLMQAPKNGFFYVVDRESGKLISAGKYAKVTWADRIDLATGRPVEAAGVRTMPMDVWPSPNGAHSWQAMAFSPRTNLAYIPEMQLGVHFAKSGGMGSGTAEKPDPRDRKGSLVAWDVVRGKKAWEVPHDYYFNGGLLATAGNLVFQGTADGWLSAYDAAKGKRLWRFYAGMGIISAPISYSVGGVQYVSVLAGYGASAGASGLMRIGWRYADPRGVLTFRLGGSAKLDAPAKRDMAVKPVDDPAYVVRAADADAGARLYSRCRLCHGGDLESSGSAPDLRESYVALSPDALFQVVHEGALVENGMPKFGALSREQTDQIYAYIRAKAREGMAGK